jgi:YD repeat-containing protein
LLSLNAPVISLSMQNISTVNWWGKISKNPGNGYIKFVSLGITFPVMSLKKPIFIASVLIAFLSCHRASKMDVTTTYDTQFEILNGKVRELTETYKTQSNDQETDITTFDKNGNAAQARQIRAHQNGIIKYSYKYDKNDKKTEITLNNGGIQATYKCDKNGRAVELNTDVKEFYVANIHLYKYDSTGNMIESDSYRDKEHLFSTKFIYNGQHLLMEEDKLDTGKRLTIRAIYSYKAFDGKHNWLKRVNNVEYYFGEIGGDNQPTVRKDTITRKITYY